MNKLCVLKNLGFSISWNLIAMGLYGYDEIPPLISRFDVVDYLDSLLTNIDEQTDNIVGLICEKEDVIKFDRFLKELANKDVANIVIQKRKWRAYLLKDLIDNIDNDYLQGLLELMEFWVSMGHPDDCPQTFPNSNDKEAIQDYFTQSSYEYNLNNNRKWVNEEIQNIVKLEG